MNLSHALYLLKEHKFSKITSKESVINIIFLIHNKVNLRLKKPLFDYDRHLEMYEAMDFKNVVISYFDFYNKFKTSTTMMLYSFHRKKNISSLYAYFKSNVHLFL